MMMVGVSSLKFCYPVTGMGTDLTITVGGGGTGETGNSCTGSRWRF